MAHVSPSQSADGETIEAADVNNPINTIANEFNGNIDNSNIDDNAAIDGSKLADGSVGQSALGDNLSRNYESAEESTSSTSYTSLTTTDSVDVTLSEAGSIRVGFYVQGQGGNGGWASVSPELSGANSESASFDNGAIQDDPGAFLFLSRTVIFTGLSAGTTTVTLKYRTSGASFDFRRRELWAEYVK